MVPSSTYALRSWTFPKLLRPLNYDLPWTISRLLYPWKQSSSVLLRAVSLDSANYQPSLITATSLQLNLWGEAWSFPEVTPNYLTSCSHFFGQWSYWGYTHTFTKLHTEVMRWISCAYECWLCMDLPEANSTSYSAWFVLSVSSLPLSVMVRSCYACVNFVSRASFMLTLRSGSSPSPTQQRDAWRVFMKYLNTLI